MSHLARQTCLLASCIERFTSADALERSLLCGRHLSLPAPPAFAARRRVVVTGIGLVTPLGVGTRRTWDRLVAGDVATSKLEGKEFEAMPCRVAARVPRGKGDGLFDSDGLQHAPASRAAPFVQMVLVAAAEALVDASGDEKAHSKSIADLWGPGMDVRCAVSVGSGIGALSDIVSAGMSVDAGQHRKVSPFFVPKVLLNMAGAQIAIRHGIRGPNHTMVTACAAGAHNIMDAAKLIALGEADMALAGGSESCVEPLAIAGFSRAKALATDYNDDPQLASRPFDAKSLSLSLSLSLSPSFSLSLAGACALSFSLTLSCSHSLANMRALFFSFVLSPLSLPPSLRSPHLSFFTQSSGYVSFSERVCVRVCVRVYVYVCLYVCVCMYMLRCACV